MQSVSPSGRLQLEATVLWDRTKEAMGGGRTWSALLVFGVTFTVARSTATFHWVDGIDAVTPIALLGALIMAALAVSPVLEPVALGIGAVLAVPASVLAAWPQIHLHNPSAVLGLQLIPMWSSAAKTGALLGDPSFFLVLIGVLMWVTGGWLAWCVLRWQKPMLGLIPGAAAFATNVLNLVPGMSDQNGYTLLMVVLTIALLLWTNYTGSIASAVRARVKMTGDARWDFWESGLVAMLGVVVFSIFLPPMSTLDRTTDVENGMFSSWAQLQQQLSHPGFISLGRGGGVTGFTDDVRLGGSLQRTRDIVFEYTLIGDFGGPRYFRGCDANQAVGNEWRCPSTDATLTRTYQKNETLSYAENYSGLGVAGFTVKMVHPPQGYSTMLFYPGQLLKIDRMVTAEQSPAPFRTFGLLSVDRLESFQPPSSAGTYTTSTEYSAATAQELENAGTAYPEWVTPLASLGADYSSPQVQARIRSLALDVTAGTKNPYDAATAIETYLRSSRFTYDLNIAAPQGKDPIEWFLFSSHRGYCEYFATAMGDMLRSIGIPARLVNGYGPGQFDSTVQSYVVRSEDAHTWVEAYFPGYGWIPFEPTADSANIYQPIVRGQVGAGACLRDEGCDQVTDTGTGIVAGGATATPRDRTRPEPIGGPAAGGISVASVFGATVLTRVAAVLLAIVLVLLIVATRYLRPRTVMAAWNRTLTLASLAGAKRRPGETPHELGRRLKKEFPEASEPIDALAGGFAVAAYAPEEIASGVRSSVMEAWTALRPVLLRRVFARLKPGSH